MCGQFSPFRRTCPGLRISGLVQGLPFIQNWTLLCLFLPVSLCASPVCTQLYILLLSSHPSLGDCPALELPSVMQRETVLTPLWPESCASYTQIWRLSWQLLAITSSALHSAAFFFTQMFCSLLTSVPVFLHPALTHVTVHESPDGGEQHSDSTVFLMILPFSYVLRDP